MTTGDPAFVVLGFDTTHSALDAEEFLLQAGVPAVPIPAPVAISARCGIALRIPAAHAEEARHVLRLAAIDVVSDMPYRDV